MSATDALHANAGAAGQTPPASPTLQPRALTIPQEALRREFVVAYDIDPDQVIFFDETENPFFLFEALAQIVNALGNFREVAVTNPEVDERTGNATCEAAITLADARVVRSFGSSFVGDTLPGKEVEDFQTAFDLSRARALRSALRLAGFDPVKKHEQHKRGLKGDEPKLMPGEEQRRSELAQIHILAAEAGLIVGEDDSRYRRQIGIFFEGLTSAADMDARQRTQFIAILRGLKSARDTVTANDPLTRGRVERTVREIEARS